MRGWVGAWVGGVGGVGGWGGLGGWVGVCVCERERECVCVCVRMRGVQGGGGHSLTFFLGVSEVPGLGLGALEKSTWCLQFHGEESRRRALRCPT